jgi:cytidine deaminase
MSEPSDQASAGASDRPLTGGRSPLDAWSSADVAELVSALEGLRLAAVDAAPVRGPHAPESHAPQPLAPASVQAASLHAASPLPAPVARLRAAAAVAMARAHAPYSGLSVGAALVARDGVVALGCNVENASYGLTLCAERNALAQARILGAHDIVAVLVTSSAGAIPPCGACRQVLAELAPRALVVATAGASVRVWRTADLLPDAFGPAGLPPRAR